MAKFSADFTLSEEADWDMSWTKLQPFLYFKEVPFRRKNNNEVGCLGMEARIAWSANLSWFLSLGGKVLTMKQIFDVSGRNREKLYEISDTQNFQCFEAQRDWN